MKYALLFFTFTLTASAACSKSQDTIKVFFRFNESALDNKDRNYLDSLAYADYYHPGQKLLIHGYADYVGTNDFNQKLSYQRASNVKDYLAANLSLQADVVMCQGKGELNGRPLTGEKGNPKNRFVEIVRIHPEARPKPVPSVTRTASDKEQPKPAPKYRHRHEEYIGARADDEMGAYMVAHNKLHEDDTDARQHESKEGRVWTGIISLHSTDDEIRRTLKKLPDTAGFAFSYAMENLAMWYGLEGKEDSVFYCLNRALDSCNDSKACKDIWDPNILGFFQITPFKDTREWSAFESRILKEFNKDKHLKNPNLALQLIIAGGADQSVRFPTPSDKEEETEHAWSRIDEENKYLIKEIVAKHGFPGISEVGVDAANNAFLMVQHLNRDTTFQKQVLRQMRKLMPHNEVSKQHVALLTDRIMIKTSGNQLYGTQFKILPAKPGHRAEEEYYPILDPAHVNDRRKQMNLPPLEEM